MAVDPIPQGPFRSSVAKTVAIAGSGALVAALGATALVGWALGESRLASAGAGLIPMAPSTALLFVLCGGEVCLRAARARHRVAAIASAVVAAFAAAVASFLLLLACLDVHTPLEHLGFGASGDVQGAPIGHMSPVTAACFLLASVSSLASFRSSAARPRRLVSLASAALLLGSSAVFLLAYLYGAPMLYGGTFIPPALTTALAFAVLGGALLALSRRSAADVAGGAGGTERHRAFDAVLVTFVLLASGLVAAGHYYYKNQERRFRATVEQQLSGIAELKVAEISEWRRERLADGAVFLRNPGFSALVRRSLETPSDPSVRAELIGWLAQFQHANRYDRVALLDVAGGEIVSVPASTDPVGPLVARRAGEALRTPEPTFLDFYRDGPDRRIFLAVLVPVVDQEPGSRPLGVLVLRTDPSTWLYPFIQRWPGASRTAETLLVRRDGGDALVLNELRFRKGTALELRSPLSDTGKSTVRAALGEQGVMQGEDYRHVPVVACVRALPDSPWTLVARMDATEVYAPMGERLWQTAFGVVLLLAGAATGLGLVFRRHSLSAEKRHRHALDSMMEGAQIIATDWRYLYVNESAARYGGQTVPGLMGRTVQEMYPGIEATPMFASLAQSMADRAALHAEFDFTLPSGEERWFEFGIHPVPEGLFVLSLDVTERKVAEEALRKKDARIVHLNAVLRGIRNVNQLITRERDPKRLIRRACELMVESRGFDTCCVVLCDGDRIKHVAEAGAEGKVRILREMFGRDELPSCVRRALSEADLVVRGNPSVACPECPVNQGYTAPRDTIAVRLENDGKTFGVMLVSVLAGMASDPEEIDLLREIAGDVAFALRGIERDADRERAIEEIENLAKFPSEDPNPVLRFAGDGKILIANASSKELLDHWGCAEGDEPPEEIRRLIRLALATGGRQETVVQVGEGREFSLTLAPVASAGYVNGYGMDVTERVGAVLDARRLNSRLLRLTQVVQDLSEARSIAAITEIVRHAARDLAGSDGATFVLREGDLCHYVDEDAIAPLWKGKRFPIGQCISGWVMLHREPAVIQDIYEDDRIPQDAYRPTFVRSLAMVPIRSENPVGAIGNYWRTCYRATPEEVRILQALADSTSVAIENVRAYKELEESEARTRAIYEHLPSPTFVWRKIGPVFKLDAFNAAARAATKGGVASFVGRSAAELPHALPHLLEDLGSCVADRAPVRRELDYVPMGSETPRRLIATYGFVPPSMVVLHTEDVTEQRQLEGQLRMAQRMEAIGRLAGGVAHDFNNLLSVILNYSSLALESMTPEDNLRADLQEIHNAGQRAATLTRQLLAFSRKQVLQPRIVNLNDVIRGMEGMLRRLIGEDIDLVTALDADIGNVRVDPGQAEQVVMNLAVNSRDAMPEGGKLTIETANAELDRQYADEHVAVRPGPYVMLSVSDTGCGMDDETRARVFEPFFTTKELGKGTGLGLATVYGIVKQSDGNIWVYSEPLRGTTFKIYLPRALSAAEEATHKAALPLSATGTETILLVEDDTSVRNLTARMLGGAGYTVLSATGGAEAVGICEGHDGPIHLLLTDVVMPQMGGRALAEKATTLRPELSVLFMSGYTDNAIVHHGTLDPGTHFIGKPFSAAELTRKVRDVLDAAQPSSGKMK